MAEDGAQAADEMTVLLAQAKQAEQYQSLIEEAVALLVEGNVAGFRQLLSPNMLQSMGDAVADATINGQLLPFFAGAINFGAETTVASATDSWGSKGLSFYKTMLMANGEERPFVIYIVEENGQPVVANVMPSRTYEDVHEDEEHTENL